MYNKGTMIYSFFGTPRFAEIVLKKLIETGMKPRVVVCNPDQPVGRDQILTPPPTKIIAAEYDILVWQPEKPLVGQFEILKNNDVFIIAAYGKIIPGEILKIPKNGSIVLHPSLLPKYRGATPIRSAILAGEKEIGVTIIKMDKKIDHGPILSQRKIKTEKKSYLELRDELAEVGAKLLIETLPKYLNNEIVPKAQNHNEATFTKKFSSDDAYVLPEKLKTAFQKSGKEAEEIERMIRALNPEPGVWTEFEEQYGNLPKGKRIKLLESEIKGGKLILTEIQIAGKIPRRVSISS